MLTKICTSQYDFPRPQWVTFLKISWTLESSPLRARYAMPLGVQVIIKSLRPRLNRRPFADDIFKCIFLKETAWISLKISLKFVPKVRINNIPALVQMMAWRRPGDKPLSEPMMVSLLTHTCICVTRPQWVNVLGLACSMHIHVKSNRVLTGPCVRHLAFSYSAKMTNFATRHSTQK